MNGQRAEATKLWWAMALAVLFVLPWSLAAQEPAADEVSAEEQAAIDEEAAHDALRALRKIYEQAVNENDLALIGPHLDDEVSGVMVTNDVVNGFESLKDYWRGILELIGEGGKYTTTLEPELSWIHGDIAVAKGGTRDHVVMPGGKEFHFTSNFTAVLVNRGGEWKIRRMHGSMNPIDNEFVEAAVRASALTAGGVGGVAGLVIGLVVGILWTRSRSKAG